MSLPIKKSRPIEIAGTACRWIISRKVEDFITNSLIVQGEGGRLSIKLKEEISGLFWLYNEKGKADTSEMTSYWVNHLCNLAIKKGWHPEKNKAFSFQFYGPELEDI